MAISINWLTKVIFVPQADLTPLGGSVYAMDVDQFRLDLKALEASDEGAPFEDTHRHNTEIVLSGVTYARFVEIINGYTVEFEDGQYQVNPTGANHNLLDVKVLNQVSLGVTNSAGLVVTSASGLTASESALLTGMHQATATRKDIDFVGDDVLGWQEVLYDDQGVEASRMNLFDETGTRINETPAAFLARGGMIARRVPA